MFPILLQAVSSTCAFGGINANDWVGICAAIIMTSLIVASFVYLVSGFLPRKEGDKIKGYVRFEYVQAGLSALLVMVLILIASATCNIGASLTTPSQDPFSFSQHYVGSLLFEKGIGLETSMYSTSIQFAVWSGVLGGGIDQLYSYFPKLTRETTIGGFEVTLKPPSDFASLYENYAAVIVDFFIPILIVSFAMLLIQFVTLPVISAVSLTVVIPVALIMRSLSFSGPRLREAANSFIAIAIAFYFIYPMTFIMDQGIVNWLYCTQDPSSTCIGNPYPQFIAKYTLNNVQQSSLFATPTASTGFLPFSFYQTAITQLGCSVIYCNSGNAFSNPFTLILYAPSIVIDLAQQLSQYLFEATVLIALNIAITIGLAYGLWKGLTGGLSFLGTEGLF
ncbi:MAG: hypothetical protein KGH53_00130 [Candidatus Micrarchaeota archaeon]|nr:hypothetical protein [Candidatus Micrarchaeota archaeon]